MNRCEKWATPKTSQTGSVERRKEGPQRRSKKRQENEIRYFNAVAAYFHAYLHDCMRMRSELYGQSDLLIEFMVFNCIEFLVPQK